jgi:hypothetical protein
VAGIRVAGYLLLWFSDDDPLSFSCALLIVIPTQAGIH